MSYLSNSVDTVVTGHGKGQREERGNVTESSRYHGCGILVLFTKKNTQFHWTSAICICIHIVRPKPKLDRMATKRTIVKPVTGETLGEQPACKTSLFSSNCKCPQYDNQFSFVQLFGESYLSCSQFFWNFVLFRKSLALGECDCLQFGRSRGSRRSRPGGV